MRERVYVHAKDVQVHDRLLPMGIVQRVWRQGRRVRIEAYLGHGMFRYQMLDQDDWVLIEEGSGDNERQRNE